MKKEFVEDLRKRAVHDRSEDVKLNPNGPLEVDKKYPDQFGLRSSEDIQKLRDAIIPDSVKLVESKDL